MCSYNLVQIVIPSSTIDCDNKVAMGNRSIDNICKTCCHDDGDT